MSLAAIKASHLVRSRHAHSRIDLLPAAETCQSGSDRAASCLLSKNWAPAGLHGIAVSLPTLGPYHTSGDPAPRGQWALLAQVTPADLLFPTDLGTKTAREDHPASLNRHPEPREVDAGSGFGTATQRFASVVFFEMFTPPWQLPWH